MLAQKLKVKWINEGDCNSSYFHKVMKERRIFNHIGPISSSGVLLDSFVDIKEEVWRHFSKIFVDSERERGWFFRGSLLITLVRRRVWLLRILFKMRRLKRRYGVVVVPRARVPMDNFLVH